jgi:transposase
MEVVHARCAGLDVHQKTVVACARLVKGRVVEQKVETFGTTTKELLRLSDWLTSLGCTHVAMESTGVYWKPVWHVLEGSFELVLANAAAIRNLPGRKTDINDAMWIADLLAHGLIRGSFVPPTAVHELRDLTRSRAQLVHEAARHTQRIQKTLEDANIKLTGMISSILGVTGRAIVEAIIAGETDPEALVNLRRGSLKASPEELREALRGSVRDHHRFMLRLHLNQIQALEQSIRELEERLDALLEPFQLALDLLMTIPGVGHTTARVLLSEVGLNWQRFPTPGHLVSWAGLCPRCDESAGKTRSRRLRQGNTWLKSTLVQAAWAATKTKNSALRSRYLRIRSTRGPKRAVVAVAASILASAYVMLQRGLPYQELGPDYLAARNPEKAAKRLVRRLQHLGYEVEIHRAAA